MRSPAGSGESGRAKQKSNKSSHNIHEIIADQQASYVSRTYRVAYATASTIAALAWGCAR
ncbi:hypothetical protein CO678_39530 [Bradyrhizobium diazoefficiens]|nr:hypothetical protein CO678_39530 [Bradyrhizobium diazoefficiens]